MINIIDRNLLRLQLPLPELRSPSRPQESGIVIPKPTACLQQTAGIPLQSGLHLLKAEESGEAYYAHRIIWKAPAGC